MTVQAFEIQSDRIKKVLVCGPNWVGDAMMCVPALDTIRRAFPDSEISLLVRPTAGELFVGHPGVDRVVVYEHRGMHAGWRGKFKLAGQSSTKCSRWSMILNSFHGIGRLSLAVESAYVNYVPGLDFSSHLFAGRAKLHEPDHGSGSPGGGRRVFIGQRYG